MWFPTQDLSQFRVVAKPPSYTLRRVGIVSLFNAHLRNRYDVIYQVVDAHDAVGSDVQGLAVIRCHEP